MSNAKRKAIPSEEKDKRTASAKVIGEGDLAASGKKNPASINTSGILPEEEKKEKDVNKSIYVPIIKASNEERTITGVVLQPEVVDAQGDIMDKEVIRKAAHDFLSRYNRATELGLMHKYFGNGDFDLYESWLAPQDVSINSTIIKEGSWILTVYVVKDKIWKMVKEAKLKGFSIGGKAKAKNIKSEKEGLDA